MEEDTTNNKRVSQMIQVQMSALELFKKRMQTMATLLRNLALLVFL